MALHTLHEVVVIQCTNQVLSVTAVSTCLQAASPELPYQVQGCGDQKDGRLSSATDGQVQLHQVQLHCGTILPEYRERDQDRCMPFLSVSGAI